MKTWLKTVLGAATLAAFALLVICIVLRPSRVHNAERNTRRALTLKDILNGTFSYKTYFPNWISEQEYLHQSEDDNIVLYNIGTRESYIILSNSTMVCISIV
ncbi:prolyl endopeptidase FAP-like [Acomys russatus]|uniref:prolyl endopeptidase FAP-like n=1 Tax=Acomys russatus TaxID=60746 RepID=UPI0021E1F872|nr:prolyl endopeptidase FAP-like [Acomys russatus]XP_051022639.1 prolyl endopeptidase FAP-like [Acomys russatus]